MSGLKTRIRDRGRREEDDHIAEGKNRGKKKKIGHDS